MPEPTFVFEADLGAGDSKRYLALPFDVPPGTGKLCLDLHYEPVYIGGPKEVQNQVSITLFDPEGFRGGKHSGENHKAVSIGPAEATPGFRPGPLPAGRWTLELDTHLVLPGVPLNYRAEVRLVPGEGAGQAPAPWQPQPPVHRAPGWYRGDLHTHTLHSDGRQTVAELLQSAREAGLHFLGLTDHNAVAQIQDPAALACRDLALVPGMELTTYYGHALSLGTTHWTDWRTTYQGRTMGDAARDIRDAGGLSVIAHPAALGDPVCTGCSWLYTDEMPGVMDAVEVWNGPWFEMGTNNPLNLHLWKQWLGGGRRLVATAGTDTHDAERYRKRPPFSLVYAPELSAPGILEGVRRGHVMLSVGPEVYMEAALTGGRLAIMGDAVRRAEVTAYRVHWQGAPTGSTLRCVAGGETVAEWHGTQGAASPALPAGARWALAELWSTEGALLAVTNPLYIN